MSELDHEIRRGLERLTALATTSDRLTFEQLAARRRRRRTRNTALMVLPVVALLGLVADSDDDSRKVATGGDETGSSPTQTVAVERTEVVGGDGGTARVVLEFDGPLPGGDPVHVEGITSPDAADGIFYTTQEPGRVQVCESTHSFPPPSKGTVDLLIPAAWFRAGENTHTSPLDVVGNPSKFFVCGPNGGFYQYAIWGPVSADSADVTVTVDRDRSRLTVQIGSTPDTTATSEPPALAGDLADAAKSIVADFLDDLRRGDVTAAAQRWTGYPELLPDASAADRARFVAELLDDPAVARLLGAETTTFVTASWGWTSAAPVVTVLAPRDGEDPPVAVAFLVGRSDEQGDPGVLWIHRMPMDGRTEPDLPADAYVEPGQQIVLPGVPVEGGARAYINEIEVPVDIDAVDLSMTITIPDGIEGDAAITFSTATPELPGAQAFAVTIRSP